MPNIKRARLTFSGTPFVGPSTATFYFAESFTGITAALEDFATILADRMPTGGGLNPPSEGDVLDAATGDLVGGWTETPVAGIGASGPPAHAAGVGARIVWQTEGFSGGRRVRGSTFIVPLSSDQYDSDGTLKLACKTDLDSAADTLLSAVGSDMRIWSRPRPGRAGGVSTVTAGAGVDQVSWLRSRRT